MAMHGGRLNFRPQDWEFARTQSLRLVRRADALPELPAEVVGAEVAPVGEIIAPAAAEMGVLGFPGGPFQIPPDGGPGRPIREGQQRAQVDYPMPEALAEAAPAPAPAPRRRRRRREPEPEPEPAAPAPAPRRRRRNELAMLLGNGRKRKHKRAH